MRAGRHTERRNLVAPMRQATIGRTRNSRGCKIFCVSSRALEEEREWLSQRKCFRNC